MSSDLSDRRCPYNDSAHAPGQDIPPDNLTAYPAATLPGVFHQVLEYVPEAVVEVDGSGQIVFANSRVEAIFGYRPSELMNCPVEILIPKELQAAHAGMRAAHAKQPVNREMGTTTEFAGLRKSGTRFSADVALSAVRLENYPPSHTFAFVRDVTNLRRMEIAERELLDNTLLGIVTTLNNLMSMTSPLIFDRTQSIRALVSHMATQLRLPNAWEYNLAAALCLIGCTTMPPAVFEKAWSGAKLSQDEERVFRSHPAIGAKLLEEIRRLDGVVEIIGKQQTGEGSESAAIELGILILQLAQEADRLLYRKVPMASVMVQLRSRSHQFPESLLGSMASYVPHTGAYEVRSVRMGELRAGMVLEEDLSTDCGMLIAPKQTKVNTALIERIRNFSHTLGVPDTFLVGCPV